MSEDRSRYGIDKLDPFGRQLAEAADKHWFTFRPWDTYGLNDQQLVECVRSDIQSNGHWSSYAELAMGSGMVVRIDPVVVNNDTVFRATGGDPSRISAAYPTHERALDMVALICSTRLGDWCCYELD